MNRLVIIGNGFDLAHGLPTSYKDFIDDFWKTACDTKQLKKIKYISELVDVDCEFGHSTNDDESLAIEKIYNYKVLEQFVDRNYKNRQDGFFAINFKNDFFEKICKKNSIENWVDIENEYYRELKK